MITHVTHEPHEPLQREARKSVSDTCEPLVRVVITSFTFTTYTHFIIRFIVRLHISLFRSGRFQLGLPRVVLSVFCWLLSAG